MQTYGYTLTLTYFHAQTAHVIQDHSAPTAHPSAHPLAFHSSRVPLQGMCTVPDTLFNTFFLVEL